MGGKGNRSEIIAAAVCAVLAFPAGASADTFDVTNDHSSGPGSLSQAVADANAGPDGENTVTIEDLGPAAQISPAAPLAIGPNDIEIEGPGRDRLTIGLDSSGFSSTDANISLSGMTLSDAFSSQAGAVVKTDSGDIGLDHALVTANTVRAHDPSFRGGLLATGSGAVAISDSRITGNDVFDGVVGNPPSIQVRGGIVETGTGELALTRSSISNNRIRVRATGTAPPPAVLGGSIIATAQPATLTASAAVFNDAEVESNGNVSLDGTVLLGAGGEIINSTFGQNGLSSSQAVGGHRAAVFNGGQLAISHTTIVLNYGTESSGLYTAPGAQSTLDNTMIAKSVTACTGATISAGHNFDDDGSCGLDQPTDLPDNPSSIGYPTLLAGQNTEVVPLNFGSAAIDAGAAGSVSTDQTGGPRTIDSPYPDLPGGDGTDIGAVEAGTETFPECQGRTVTLANRTNDPLVGTPGYDVIIGSGSLDGAGGNDILCGYGYGTLIKGGPGDDLIEGGYGNQIIRGGSGTDTLSGGEDGDTIYGSAGDDLLFGEDGDDVLFGGPGHDACSGGYGIDHKRKTCEVKQIGGVP